MGDRMEDDQQKSSRNRKRSSAWLNEDATNDSDEDPQEIAYTPSKRLLNAHGDTIHQNQPIRYHAQKLLNHLAFARVYVTANFQKYNSGTSPIVLCIAPIQNGVYQALCDILPSLYASSPTLQALAVTDEAMDPMDILDPSLLRSLPFIAAVDLELSIADDFRAFRRDLGHNASCIALIDPRGVCVWTSADAGDNTKLASSEFEGLLKALADVATSPDVRDVDMKNGRSSLKWL